MLKKKAAAVSTCGRLCKVRSKLLHFIYFKLDSNKRPNSLCKTDSLNTKEYIKNIFALLVIFLLVIFLVLVIIILAYENAKLCELVNYFKQNGHCKYLSLKNEKQK